MLRLLTTVIASFAFSFAAFAQDDENTLMIEVAGQISGIVEIELLPEVAPLHVERIKILARDGAYNDVAFHRVIEGFMAQSGDVKHGKLEKYIPRYAGLGGSNYPMLKQEFSDVPFERGVVGMARSAEVDSANSQFFIMFAPAPFLDGKYTVFGKVIKGQAIVDRIKRGEPVQEPDYMKRVWIKADG